MSYALQAAHEVLKPSLLSTEAGTALAAAKCYGLLIGYDTRWIDAPYRIDAVECVMTSDLYNPETQRKSRSFTNAGKIDVRATEIATGDKVIIDHKTSSQEIDDPGAPYWQQLVVEGQVTHYMLLEWLNANKVEGAIWDVMRKPSIAPKIIPKKDRADLEKTGLYFDFMPDATELEILSADPDGRETPLMYAARLAHDCKVERPGWYFQRRKIARQDSDVIDYAQELWGHGQDILATRASGRHPRNSGACFAYNSPCKFLGVCSGRDSIDSEKWSRKTWVHNELPILSETEGKEVLTNSRIRCFQSCRQKHYFQYELGVERVDEEEKEALFFGTMMHNALEQYFLALQQQQKG